MRFNLENPTGKAAAEKKLSELTGIIELKKIEKTRSDRQNRALHLFFTKICEQFNNAGETIKAIKSKIEFYNNYSIDNE
jgi:hypothetical protein